MRKKLAIVAFTSLLVISAFSLAMANSVPSLTWLPPLSNQEILKVKDGSTLPIRFSLLDSEGDFVTNTDTKVLLSKVHFTDEFEEDTIGDSAINWQPNAGNWLIGQDNSQIYSQDTATAPATSETLLTFDRTEGGGITIAANVKLVQADPYKGRGIFWQSDADNYVWFFYVGHLNGFGLNIKVDGTTIVSWADAEGFVSVDTEEWEGSEWHRMSLFISGDTVQCFRDAQNIFTFSDPEIVNLPQMGKVQLFSYGAHVYFDDIMVRTPIIKIFEYGKGDDNLRISKNAYIVNLHTKQLGLEPGKYLIMVRAGTSPLLGVKMFEITEDIQGIGRGKK